MRAVQQLLANSVASASWLPKRARTQALRWCGYRIGSGFRMNSGGIVRSRELTIGNDVFINHRVIFDEGPITIGDHVYVSAMVFFASVGHSVGPAWKRASGAVQMQPIRIGAGSWIGASATILGGVDVAPGCIIAAGAVVTKSTAPNGLYGGVPARRIRDLA